MVCSRRKTMIGVSLITAAALFGAVSQEAPAPRFVPAREEARGAAASAAEPLDPEQRVLVRYLSRRFYISAEATERVVATAQRAADEVGLDPLLVLAVISVESSFNPLAESVMGAKGLMQIIPRYHGEKLRALGGEDAVFDPQSNIHVGTRILQEYVHRMGTLEAGLQFYNGALRDHTAQYAQKVIAERERLELVVRGARRSVDQDPTPLTWINNRG